MVCIVGHCQSSAHIWQVHLYIVVKVMGSFSKLVYLTVNDLCVKTCQAHQ